MDVADPSSPKYGKHWTAAEVHAFFAPAEQALDEVKQWLIDHGIQADDIVHFENKGWLALDVPASKVEELFKTSLFEHEDSTSGAIRIGCSDYHVPEHLTSHIDYSKHMLCLALRCSHYAMLILCVLSHSHPRRKVVTTVDEEIHESQAGLGSSWRSILGATLGTP